MYSILKPLIFRFSPEKAHHLTMQAFYLALAVPGMRFLLTKIYQVTHPSLEKTIWGFRFKNPVGLAAGFDKDGKYFDAMSVLGFGAIEIGTVTPKPQDGNPTPRLFRLPKDQALINRMGFNNEGADVLAERLAKRKKGSFVLGINIGKNKTTSNENADADYVYCFEKLFPYADYFVVNVSSPNTPDLRALQDKEPLTKLLSQLQKLNQQKATPKPILLKIAPDLNLSQLQDIVSIIKDTALAGVIATNTTIDRNNLNTPEHLVQSIGAGGLSGKTLAQKSTDIIRFLRKNLPLETVIIGVGGIQTGKDAQEKLEAGADLIQVYTGLVYEGPAIVRRINTFLKGKYLGK